MSFKEIFEEMTVKLEKEVKENNVQQETAEWFLIRLEQYLGEFDDKYHNDVYNFCINAFRYGKSYRNYWNNSAQVLFNAIINGEVVL